MSSLTAHRLAKRYGSRTVVEDVSLMVRSGEVVGFLGPNGAGKSTSFHMLVGLIPADDGTIHLDELDLTDRPMHVRARLGLGYLPQEPSVFRKLTVERNLLAVLELRRELDTSMRKQWAVQLMHAFGLEHLRDARGENLSGGERRRVEIARALAARPRFMLLDEPFAGLEKLGLCAEPEEVEAVLKRVQRFEPPGVAARSLSECLLRQLEETAADTPHRNLAMRVARHHLEALARHDHAGLARRLETTRGELEAAHALLRSLTPRPGAGYAGTPTEYVTPDLGVFRVAGAWRVELNADAVPRLRVNPVYAELARRGGRGPEAASLRQHLAEARWLIRSLANRAETLLRVARAIVRRQEAFLERGEEGMRPLVLRDIASELDLHESTVSRVTSRKYVQTPRGVFELKHFFSNRVANAEGGGASATAIRARLRKIIEGEEPGRPWSDQRLASDLERAGFRVARRTVAKYRESMGIPPSSERRRARAGAVNLNVSA